MPEPGFTHLVACDSLAEARQLSARVRAGLPLPAPGSPAERRGRCGATEPAGAGAADAESPRAAWQSRLDRLEQALAAAGTFA